MNDLTTSAPSVSTSSEFQCINCGSTARTPASTFRCPHCGDLLEIIYPAWRTDSGLRPRGLNAAALKALWRQRRKPSLPIDRSGVWRFRELLPDVDPAHIITLREGNPPLYPMPSCSRRTGVLNLYALHQGMNPTGSFKDAGMTVAASFARQAGFGWVACASTGNTSASAAAYAAHGGLRGLVLIPEGQVAWGKLSQALDYGALTCQLRTDFDGCLRVLQEVVQRTPIYLLNSVNPYRIEGQKIAAVELLEQMDWVPPDHVIVPGGNLGNSSALGKAFLEMQQLGFIEKLPKISIVQAEGANPLLRTVRETGGKKLISVQAQTAATAIRIGSPASWRKAVHILEATGGTVEQVSEAEIALAKAEIGADGIGCEPASAVTLAGLKTLLRRGFVNSTQTVVLILTGHLLKDPDFTIKFHRGELFTSDGEQSLLVGQRRAPIMLDASVEAVLRAIESLGSE